MCRNPWAALAGLTLLLAACAGEATAPQAVPAPPAHISASPTFLELIPNAPPMASTSVSFWAVHGQNREASLYFQHPGGGTPTGSDRAVRFRVRKQSLDGATLNGVAVGDSVLITMTVVDVQHQIFEFQPAGLHFNPRDAAKLTVGYRYANRDFNHDGVINGADIALEGSFAIWRQEGTVEPFEAQASEPVPGLDQVGSDVAGFTRFAVAY